MLGVVAYDECDGHDVADAHHEWQCDEVEEDSERVREVEEGVVVGVNALEEIGESDIVDDCEVSGVLEGENDELKEIAVNKLDGGMINL